MSISFIFIVMVYLFGEKNPLNRKMYEKEKSDSCRIRTCAGSAQ